jgi:hypothetical protein
MFCQERLAGDNGWLFGNKDHYSGARKRVPIDVAKIFDLAGSPLASAKGFFSAQVQRQIQSHPR